MSGELFCEAQYYSLCTASSPCQLGVCLLLDDRTGPSSSWLYRFLRISKATPLPLVATLFVLLAPR
jgi:hypothetical protein